MIPYPVSLVKHFFQFLFGLFSPKPSAALAANLLRISHRSAFVKHFLRSPEVFHSSAALPRRPRLRCSNNIPNLTPLVNTFLDISSPFFYTTISAHWAGVSTTRYACPQTTLRSFATRSTTAGTTKPSVRLPQTRTVSANLSRINAFGNSSRDPKKVSAVTGAAALFLSR